MTQKDADGILDSIYSVNARLKDSLDLLDRIIRDANNIRQKILKDIEIVEKETIGSEAE